MKIALDIGANDGKDSIRLLEEGYKVYAFEPLKNMFKYFVPIEQQYPHFTYLPVGVDLTTGIKTFYSNDKLSTISSLHKFNTEISDKWWPGQKVDTQIRPYKIYTISLYDFCTIENITSIDYLHCDTQGNDFRVLQSLQDKISIVKQGVVEASGERGLYQVDNNIEDIKVYLKQHGFTYFKESIRKSDNLEFDLYFSR